jgi:hypothetical protein
LYKRLKLRDIDIGFGIRDVWSFCRASSIMIFEKEISECKLDLVEVQEVRQDRGGTQPAGE